MCTCKNCWAPDIANGQLPKKYGCMPVYRDVPSAVKVMNVQNNLTMWNIGTTKLSMACTCIYTHRQ